MHPLESRTSATTSAGGAMTCTLAIPEKRLRISVNVAGPASGTTGHLTRSQNTWVDALDATDTDGAKDLGGAAGCAGFGDRILLGFTSNVHDKPLGIQAAQAKGVPKTPPQPNGCSWGWLASSTDSPCTTPRAITGGTSFSPSATPSAPACNASVGRTSGACATADTGGGPPSGELCSNASGKNGTTEQAELWLSICRELERAGVALAGSVAGNGRPVTGDGLAWSTAVGGQSAKAVAGKLGEDSTTVLGSASTWVVGIERPSAMCRGDTIWVGKNEDCKHDSRMPTSVTGPVPRGPSTPWSACRCGALVNGAGVVAVNTCKLLRGAGAGVTGETHAAPATSVAATAACVVPCTSDGAGSCKCCAVCLLPDFRPGVRHASSKVSSPLFAVAP
mmetsp:Transcript_95110/g.254168  ORF Transcript_95110/g.254168 Transcript_95110/m.254168 type:complete len:392 (-) Transcript_95110:614-1789(-)